MKYEELTRFLIVTWRSFIDAIKKGWRILLQRGPGQVQFWLIALIVGIVAGLSTVAFMKGISALQSFFYGADDIHLHTQARKLHWAWILFLPVAGGLIVGQILTRFTSDGRPRSIANVIEGAAIRDGRVREKSGIASTLASMVTLSMGGSAGREGPAVHIGAIISSYVSRLINADGVTARDLMGCAVASAVATSFNAPFAGALFALEVVLRHFALHAFAPIAIASVSGSVISRLFFGDLNEFSLPEGNFEFYAELPAFMILGIVCGLVAFIFMRLIFMADDFADIVQTSFSIPDWLRPACAGLLLGLIALSFPEIIGIGHETTRFALTGQIVFWNAVIITAVKIIAVAINMAGRLGGGIFGPSLMIGALTGLAFGWVATGANPSASGSETLYALAGMAAVSAAVLGAPISTSIIVFEMTGNWQISVVVLVAVSLATALSSRLVNRSFFLTQLERRGVHIAAGPQAYLLATVHLGGIMRLRGSRDGASDMQCLDLAEQGSYLTADATLEDAMPLFEHSDLQFIPIVEIISDKQTPVLLGAVYYTDALKKYNRMLSENALEEHR